MERYIVKRLVQSVFVLLFISIMVFLLGRLTGDPVSLLLTEYSTEEDRIRLTKQLGLDQPLPIQYAIFLGNAIRGDLGRSIRGDRSPASELIIERVPATMELAGVSLVITLVFGIPLGVLSALKKGSLLDISARVFALLGQAAPVFWIAILAMYVFSVGLHLLPSSGYGRLEHFILPAFSMGLFQVAAVTRLTRSSMLDALRSEYIKLARIKGLSSKIVIWKHALRNSLIPVLTFLGTIFGRAITGAVIVETVFAWPGVGRLAYQSVMERDFPVVQAVVLFMSAMFMLVNLVVDVLYAYVDPRIRYT
jgi:ABC-type dipeptide/oligopeptide/nickel transport system permease component